MRIALASGDGTPLLSRSYNRLSHRGVQDCRLVSVEESEYDSPEYDGAAAVLDAIAVAAHRRGIVPRRGAVIVDGARQHIAEKALQHLHRRTITRGSVRSDSRNRSPGVKDGLVEWRELSHGRAQACEEVRATFPKTHLCPARMMLSVDRNAGRVRTINGGLNEIVRRSLRVSGGLSGSAVIQNHVIAVRPGTEVPGASVRRDQADAGDHFAAPARRGCAKFLSPVTARAGVSLKRRGQSSTLQGSELEQTHPRRAAVQNDLAGGESTIVL